jgi:hypothetical protein
MRWEKISQRIVLALALMIGPQMSDAATAAEPNRLLKNPFLEPDQKGFRCEAREKPTSDGVLT